MGRIGLILLLLLTGCSFRGEVTKTDDGYEWKANRPCHIKMGDFEADGKGEPFFNFEVPVGKLGG